MVMHTGMQASIRKLISMDALVTTSKGLKGVRVSLQCRAAITGPSRDARRRSLRAAFENVADAIRTQGAEVNLDSISVSGQIAEAILPISSIDEITKALDEQDVRVDVLIDRQIV